MRRIYNALVSVSALVLPGSAGAVPGKSFYYRSCGIIPSAFGSDNSIIIYDLLYNVAVAVVGAVEAYYAADYRIVAPGKTLAYGKGQHVFSIHRSQPGDLPLIKELIKSAYDQVYPTQLGNTLPAKGLRLYALFPSMQGDHPP